MREGALRACYLSLQAIAIARWSTLRPSAHDERCARLIAEAGSDPELLASWVAAADALLRGVYPRETVQPLATWGGDMSRGAHARISALGSDHATFWAWCFGSCGYVPQELTPAQLDLELRLFEFPLNK